MQTQSIAQILSQIAARFRQLQYQISGKFIAENNSDLNKQNASSSSINSALSPRLETGDWWARLYRGLVMDCSARHYLQMGQAVWLFLYFLLNANWKTGQLYRRLSTICEDTGFNPYAVRRWLRVLQRNGYVNAYYNGRFWVIAVNKWKPVQALFRGGRKPAPARWRS